MYLGYKKVWERACPPTRANFSDAGLDVFWSPEEPEYSRTLMPGESKLFETGLSFEVPHGYMLQVMNRGSMGSKGLVVGAHVVDAGYNGQVFIDIHNISTQPINITEGQKIAQLVMIPVVSFTPLEQNEIYKTRVAISSREDGALGSTGT